jgi:crotonobetainyl-CoA:carnitine CoA-transferase CaiB-like acyl-CoA transferase
MVWLEGIRVIDFTNLLPGPYATLRLAELGAEIIKIEPPNGGDPARHVSPKIDGTGAIFLANHRNKQSVELDLKTDEGRTAAMSLIEDADVVIEGFRPGVMRKLGLDYDAVRVINPRIVYCSLTGYGQTGPLAHLAGHDLNYVALSGVLAQLRGEDGRLVMPSVQLGDIVGGIVASEAILAALVHRGRTGEGAYLDVAMTDALAGMLTYQALVQQATDYQYGIPQLHGTVVCYHLYDTADGRTISLGALEPKFWRNFCEAVGKPAWIDSQFSESVDGQPVYEEMKAMFRSRSLTEWTEFGRQVDCCLQPVWGIGEFLESDYAKARHITVQLDTPSGGKLRLSNTHAGGHRFGRTERFSANPPEYIRGGGTE